MKKTIVKISSINLNDNLIDINFKLVYEDYNFHLYNLELCVVIVSIFKISDNL